MLTKYSQVTSTKDKPPSFRRDLIHLEAAVLAGHRQAVELLLHQFANNTLSLISFPSPSCIARHLGAAAAFLGRHEEARRHYQEAIRVATEMRFRPELALTHLQFADLLLDICRKKIPELTILDAVQGM